jgi:hypothetical protein
VSRSQITFLRRPLPPVAAVYDRRSYRLLRIVGRRCREPALSEVEGSRYPAVSPAVFFPSGILSLSKDPSSTIPHRPSFPILYVRDQLLTIGLPISHPDTTVNRQSVQRFQSSNKSPPRPPPNGRANLPVSRVPARRRIGLCLLAPGGNRVGREATGCAEAAKDQGEGLGRHAPPVVISDRGEDSHSFPLAPDDHLSGIAYVVQRVEQNARTDRLPCLS